MTIAENTQYRGKQILIGRMNDLNTTTRVASKAIDVSRFVTAFTVDDKPQKETVDLIANGGQQAADIVGSRKYSGNLDINVATGLLIALVSGTYGSATQTATTASVWALSTLTVKDEVKKLSGGKYIVAQNAGTTGLTEPVITGKADYDNLAVDGDVIWKLRDNLYTSTAHTSGFCTDKFFIIERVQEGCGSSNVFDTIMENVEMTSFNFSKADGTIGVKQSIPLMATKSRRSSELDFKDVTVTSTFTPRDITYINDDCTIRVDGAKYGTLHNFSLNYTRNVSMLDSTEPKEQIVKVNSPTFSGEAVIELDPVEYEVLLKQDVKAVAITMTKGDGEKVSVSVPTVTFDEPEIQTNGNEPRLLKAMLKPTGSASQAMATWTIQTATAWSL